MAKATRRETHKVVKNPGVVQTAMIKTKISHNINPIIILSI